MLRQKLFRYPLNTVFSQLLILLKIYPHGLNYQAKNEGTFPNVLKQFENKLFDITINITSNNLKNGSRVYEASEICDKIESGASFDPSVQKDSEMPDAPTVNVRIYFCFCLIQCNILPNVIHISKQLEDDNNNTPHTGTSSNKTRPRTDIEPLPFDTNKGVPPKLMRNEKKNKV